MVMNRVFGSDWVGRIIDQKFPLIEVLGGFAESNFFRTELNDDAQVERAAIKLIPSDAVDAEAQLADWKMAASLSHPHLSRILYYGRTEVDGVDLLYVVTEFPEETLSQVIPERPLSSAETREMLDPVLKALSYLHGKGIVHGQLKPSNILVIQDQVKLSTDSLSRAGSVTKSYPVRDVHTAPEIEGGTISPAADVWSLGVTLVESLTQHPPEVNRATSTNVVVPEHIPQPFSEIAGRCLRDDPARRPTVDQIATLLVLGQAMPEPASEIDADVPAGLGEPEKTREAAASPRPRGLMVGAVVVAILVVIAIWVLRSHKPQPTMPSTPESAQNGSAAGHSTIGSTLKGEAITQVQPDVSAAAVRTIKGKVDVEVRVNVDPSGDVSDARLEGRASSRYFAGRAVEAAGKWKFKPAQENGRAVSSEWRVQFEFRGNGTSAVPEEILP
jgi:TonB family protein